MLAEFRGKIPSVFYLVTQFDKRFSFSKLFLQRAKDMFGTQLLSVMIRTNIHLREAASLGLSIFEHKRDSRGAEDYTKLAGEIEAFTKNMSWVHLFLKGRELNDVYVVGEFNRWQKNEHYKLKKLDADTWSIHFPLKKGTYHYKFIADNKWLHDPSNTLSKNDSFGGKNSILLIG